MRLVRFRRGRQVRHGLLVDGRVEELRGSPFRGPEPTGRRYALDEVRLLAPVQPSKVVCVGLNYRDHAAEIGAEVPKEPLIFLKPATAVIGPGDGICYPRMSQRVDYEAELAVVIGRRARNLNGRDARRHIFGYCCANDVTARDLQSRDGQWTRAKSFDTFCPLGPFVSDEVEPGALDVECRLNGERKQASNTAQFIFDVDRVVSFVTQVMTLEAGDVILTGTPAGIGPMTPGDAVEVSIGGLGTLINRVVAGSVPTRLPQASIGW